MDRKADLPNAIVLEREAFRLMRHPIFMRSPVLARLLDYLVRETLEGRGHRVKSYTIAVDALGRDAEAADDVDAYARVVVGRLRRALQSVYAEQDGGERLVIDSGSYLVKLEQAPTDRDARSTAAQDRAALETPEEGSRSRILRWARRREIFALILITASAAVLVWLAHGRQERERWGNVNFPTVAVRARCLEQQAMAQDCEVLRNSLQTLLANYHGLRILDDGKGADFIIDLSGPDRPGGDATILAIQASSGRIFWTSRFRFAGPEAIDDAAQSAAFDIASPVGAINGFLRRSNPETDTPLGCWLRFTENLQVLKFGDPVVADCAADWYAVSPRHPVAGLVRGWSLTDSAMRQPTAALKQRKLDQALAVLRNALALNPETPSLQAAIMRTYSLAGNRAGVLRSARHALATGGKNRFITGIAGYGLAVWNDPEGERVLLALDSDEAGSLPWEHIGLFIAAMMREDLTQASREAAALREIETGQPILLLIEAAEQARTGRVGAAKAILARLKDDPIVRIVGAKAAIGRLPCAPEVRQRLQQWLKPAM